MVSCCVAVHVCAVKQTMLGAVVPELASMLCHNPHVTGCKSSLGAVHDSPVCSVALTLTLGTALIVATDVHVTILLLKHTCIYTVEHAYLLVWQPVCIHVLLHLAMDGSALLGRATHVPVALLLLCHMAAGGAVIQWRAHDGT